MANLNDIWNTSIADNFILRAGKKGMKHPVSWIYVCQENDITPWISGNEILILYGAGMQCDEKSLVNLVDLCNNCSVAGIIVLTGNFIKNVPEAMLKEADRVEMPIIEAPYTIPISCITKEIANIIIGQNNNVINNIISDILIMIIEKNGTAFDDYLKILQKNGYKWEKENVIFILELEKGEINERTKAIINKVINSELQTNVLYLRNERFIGLVGRNENILCEIKESARRVVEILNTKYNINCYFSIGTVVERIQEVLKSFDMAEKALVLCDVEKYDKKIVSIDDLPSIMQLLLIDYDEKTLMQIVKANLKPLISYDLNHGTELLETLKIFLEYNCNAKEAAEKLYIHRNTMSYRIKQIEKITNRKLADMKVCYEYITAYFCLKYLLLSGHKIEEINCNSGTMTMDDKDAIL